MRQGGNTIRFFLSNGRQVDEKESGYEEGNRTTSRLGEFDDVEKAIFDGWRYLGLDVAQVLSKTPREFSILLSAQNERLYDEYEKMAHNAMMLRAAYHAKKLKHKDLFKRPKDDGNSSKGAEEIRAKQAETLRWLAQFEEFRGKEGVDGIGHSS